MLLAVRLLLPFVIVLATAWPALAMTLQGKCVRVSDGDTIVVQFDRGGKREKIRLLGIDCPEVAHGPNDPGQEPWGSRAATFTRQLCLNKPVRVETDVQPRDKYRRLLGYVYVGKTFVNLELVKAGHAMTLTYPPNVAHTDAFVAAQREARNAGRGIWDPKDFLPETPHDYRHNGKGQHHSQRGTTPPQPSGSEAPDSAPATGAANPAAGFVLMNPKSGVFHEPGCRHAGAGSLKQVSRAEAEAHGRPCRVCH